MKEKLELAKAAMRAIPLNTFPVAKMISEYKSRIAAEISGTLWRHQEKERLTNETMNSVDNELNQAKDLIISDKFSPLLKSILEVGQKITKEFNEKNPNFFASQENTSSMNCSSTTDFILRILKEELPFQFNAIKEQNATENKSDQTSSPTHEPKIEVSKRKVSDAFPDTGGDSPYRKQEETLRLRQHLLVEYSLTSEDVDKIPSEIQHKIFEAIKKHPNHSTQPTDSRQMSVAKNTNSAKEILT